MSRIRKIASQAVSLAPGLIGATVAGVAAVSFSTADAINNATDQIQSSLGTTQERAEALGDVAARVWSENFAGSIEEAGVKVAEIERQLGSLADNELVAVAEGATAISDKFGSDFQENVSTVRVLTEQWGLSNQQALDFITSGFQNNLDASGDFLDSINEYSNVFGAAGFSAAEMFSIMQSGQAGGVLGVDKISDAIKEMNVRLNEGGSDVEQAFSRIGLNFGQLSDQVRRGETTWGSSFDSIIQGINAIEDPIERSQVQMAIFGTMAADLGMSFTEGLSAGATTLEDMAGSTETLNAQYSNFNSLLAEARNKTALALSPLAEQLIPIIEEFLPMAIERIEEFAGKMEETAGPAIMVINDALSRMGNALGITNEEVTGLDVVLSGLDALLDVIVIGVQAFAISMNLAATALEGVQSAGTATKGFFEGIGGFFGGGAAPDTPSPSTSPVPAVDTGANNAQFQAQLAELTRLLANQPPPAVLVKVDGQQVANVVTPKVSENVGRDLSRRNRAGGFSQ